MSGRAAKSRLVALPDNCPVSAFTGTYPQSATGSEQSVLGFGIR